MKNNFQLLKKKYSFTHIFCLFLADTKVNIGQKLQIQEVDKVATISLYTLYLFFQSWVSSSIIPNYVEHFPSDTVHGANKKVQNMVK